MKFFIPFPMDKLGSKGADLDGRICWMKSAGIQTLCRDKNVNPGSPGCSDENQILALGSQIRLH